MFERFTTEAREVVVRAQDEARDLGAAQVEPAHLLLALSAGTGTAGRVLAAAGLSHARIREELGPGGSLDADALAGLGIDLEQVRQVVEAGFGRGALEPSRPRGHLRFTDGSKDSLEQALRAAFRRGERRLDSRHVLLGLLAVGDPTVETVLRRLAVDPDHLRRRAEAQTDAA